jgi:hypothetical protein
LFKDDTEIETRDAGDGAADLRPQALDGRPYKGLFNLIELTTCL